MVAAYCEATATTLSPKQSTNLTLPPKYSLVVATCQEGHWRGRQATADLQHVPI